MESLEERMKYLSEFGQRVFAVEFNGGHYFVVESGEFQRTNELSSQKDFFLFDREAKQIGELYLAKSVVSVAEAAFDKMCGVLDSPEIYFMLTHIEITKRELRRNHLGSFLLNWGIKSMEEYMASSGQRLPLSFYRDNTVETLPFYKMWGAELNQTVPNDKLGSGCHMTIKNPQHKSEFDGKVVAVYDKPITKQDRQH